MNCWRDFGVSRITVRRAIQNLIQRGTLEIRRGLGTFVLAPKVSQDLTKLTGFVEDMDILGRKASARTFLPLSRTAESLVTSLDNEIELRSTTLSLSRFSD